jgi:hypothetical protein
MPICGITHHRPSKLQCVKHPWNVYHKCRCIFERIARSIRIASAFSSLTAFISLRRFSAYHEKKARRPAHFSVPGGSSLLHLYQFYHPVFACKFNNSFHNIREVLHISRPIPRVSPWNAGARTATLCSPALSTPLCPPPSPPILPTAHPAGHPRARPLSRPCSANSQSRSAAR